MRRRFCLTALAALVAMATTTIFLGCTKSPPPPPLPPERPTPTTPPPSPPPVPAPTPPQVSTDLTILGVTVQATQPNDGFYTHKIIATVRNNGDGWANLHGICEWDCPPGGYGYTHAGAEFTGSGASMPGHSERTFSQLFNPRCIGPPALLEFYCRLEYNKQTFTRWSGRLAIPVSPPTRR